LDGLLTALPDSVDSKGYLEVGSDHMNQGLDFFNIRDSNALAAGTQAGDYQGAHLAGQWRLRDNLWLSGSLWQRDLNGLSETYHFNSWQLSGMYRLMDGDGKIPALAMRLSTWGNYANDIGSSFPANAGVNVLLPANTQLKSIKVTNPADNNLQADLVGSWKLTPATDLSLLFGFGRTKLSYGELSGSVVQGGTLYQFPSIGVKQTLATAADGSQILADTSKFDVAKELAWSGNFVQAGINANWRTGPWTFRGGYLIYAIERTAVDDVLASRGWSSYTKIQSITLDVNYRFTPWLSVFARGQLNDKLIFNDMPVIYNTFSADLVGGRYSIFAVGLRADF
jgi:hypothetical protein